MKDYTMGVQNYLYSLPEAAKELKITRQGLFYQVKNGLVDSVRIGKRWFVTGETLQKIMGVDNS